MTSIGFEHCTRSDGVRNCGESGVAVAVGGVGADGRSDDSFVGLLPCRWRRTWRVIVISTP